MNMLTSLKALLLPGIAPASARTGSPETGDGPDFAMLMQDAAPPPSPAPQKSAPPTTAPPASAPLSSPPRRASAPVPAAPLGIPAPVPGGSSPLAEDEGRTPPSDTLPEPVQAAPLPLPSALSEEAPVVADAVPVKQARPAPCPETATAIQASPPADGDIPQSVSHDEESDMAEPSADDAVVTVPATPLALAPTPAAVAPPSVVQTPPPSPATATKDATTPPVTGSARPAPDMTEALAMPTVDTPQGASVVEQPTLSPALPAPRAPGSNGASQPLSPDAPPPVMVTAPAAATPSVSALPVATAEPAPPPSAIAPPATTSEAPHPASPAPVLETSQAAALPRRSMTEVMSLLQLARDQLQKQESDAGAPVADRAPDVPTGRHATPEAVATTPILSPTAAPPSPVQAMTAFPTVDLSATLGAQVVDMGVSGQWIDGLARDIARFSADGAQSRFQIEAGQLGPVQVDIRQGTDGAAVSLTVASDIAEQALRQESDRMRNDPALSAIRVADMKIERGHVVSETARADGGNHPSSQQSSGQQGQGGWTPQGQQHGWSQSSAQSHMQGRGQGRDNFGSGAKAQGDAVVLQSEQAGGNAADLPRARYA